MKKIVVCALGLAFTVSLCLAAQAKDEKGCPHKDGKGSCPMGHFKMMDANKDGKVSQKEWDDFHAKMFKNMDKNKDGFLAGDELKPPKGHKPVKK